MWQCLILLSVAWWRNIRPLTAASYFHMKLLPDNNIVIVHGNSSGVFFLTLEYEPQNYCYPLFNQFWPIFQCNAIFHQFWPIFHCKAILNPPIIIVICYLWRSLEILLYTNSIRKGPIIFLRWMWNMISSCDIILVFQCYYWNLW